MQLNYNTNGNQSFKKKVTYYTDYNKTIYLFSFYCMAQTYTYFYFDVPTILVRHESE